MREPLDVIDAIFSTRSIRYFRPDPIPEDVLWAILDAAIRGPNGANRQTWGWVVIRDPELKKPIAEFYRQGWERTYGVDRDDKLAASSDPGGFGRASWLAVEHLAHHIAEAPVWVMPVLWASPQALGRVTGSSIYGAVQNLMLAARAYGIGSVFAGFYSWKEAETKQLLGIPDDRETMGVIPLGYPAKGTFGTPKRRPVEEVVHWDGWEHFKERPAGRP